MVITRVMYYKCNAPPRTYHYITLRDKVQLAHLWCEDHTIAHLRPGVAWGAVGPLALDLFMTREEQGKRAR